jgi:hypothetical protein
MLTEGFCNLGAPFIQSAHEIDSAAR